LDNFEGGVRAVFHLSALRPLDQTRTRSDQMVLVATGAPGEVLSCSWELTSKGLDGVVSGVLKTTIGPVRDVSNLLRSAIAHLG
jgi:hypothetical protein